MRFRNVLIVDDDKAALKLYRYHLSKKGYKLKTAEDSLEAIELLKSFAPDIIISDIVMPKMDGYQLVKYLRQHDQYAHIPVIFVSSSIIDESEARRIEEAGVAGAISKIDLQQANLPERLIQTMERVEKKSDFFRVSINKEEIPEQSNEALKTLIRELLDIKLWHEGILEQLDKGLVLIDEHRRIFFVNKKAEHILNMIRSELFGKDILDFVSPKYLERLKVISDSDAAGDYRTWRFFLPFVDQILKINATPIISSQGKYLGKILIFSRYSLTPEINRFLAELHTDILYRLQDRYSQLMEKLDIIHQLIPADSEIDGAELLDSLKNTAKKFDVVISDLRNMARFVSPEHRIEPKMTDISQLLKELARTLYYPAANRGITIETDLLPHPPSIKVDHRRFQQVLHTITQLGIKNAEPLSTLEINLQKQSSHLVVKIYFYVHSDSPLLERQPFMPSDYSLEGSDNLYRLLALMRDLVLMMQGDLSFEILKEGRACFMLKFPIAKKTEEIRKFELVARAKLPETTKEKLIVSIMDDENQFYRKLGELAASQGIEIRLQSGKIDILQSTSLATLRYILINTNTKGVDHYSITRNLFSFPYTRGSTIVLSHLIFTGHDSSKAILGVDDYLPSPIHYSRLVEILQHYLGEKETISKTVHIISPEEQSVHSLESFIVNNGYKYQFFYDLGHSVKGLESGLPDLIMLDNILLEDGGYEFIEFIKQEAATSKIPLILFFAYSEQWDVWPQFLIPRTARRLTLTPKGLLHCLKSIIQKERC